MKLLLTHFLAFFLFLGSYANPGRKITGTVTDAVDRKAISGVQIIALPSNKKTSTDSKGKFELEVGTNDKTLKFLYLGYSTHEVKIGKSNNYAIELFADVNALNEVVVMGYQKAQRKEMAASVVQIRGLAGSVAGISVNKSKRDQSLAYAPLEKSNTEGYASIEENGFQQAKSKPLSTFSTDVDVASYANVRRFINNGNLPPKDAVRIEEMVNYFDYNYPQPKGEDPVSITTELGSAPWNSKHQLLHIGIKAKNIMKDNLPASNMVFLIDVSGSMDSPNKLPLLVSSLKLLTDQLREKDRVAIVVYAGNSGLALPVTRGSNKAKIKEVLNNLSAGGSTAGGAGIELAYKVASENFIKGGNNRVILATDGDFNVGASSNNDMEKLIEEKRKSGIFLTVLGYGMGNYKDSKMEILADKGNGNYAYIDNINEARKVLISEFGGTLFTVAKDVKLQLEFNPSYVQAYRLIGYENRLLNDEDFNDDQKDAGEIGSGQTVTALYEIIPVGVKSELISKVDDLKYQKKEAVSSSELLTVKLRYKQPDGAQSKLMSHAVTTKLESNPSDNFRFSSAVATFGMLIRDSQFKQDSKYAQVIDLAKNAIGVDQEGYRAEFLKLVRSSELLAKDKLEAKGK